MQVFILGKTKSGKSTLANICQEQGYVIYEAGSWARKEFDVINLASCDEFSSEYKENLTNYALNKLKEDNYYSVKKYESFLLENTCDKKLIVGVRNPDDFLNMLRLDQDNKVIFITSKKKHQGSLELFEQGLKIIQDYLDWRKILGNEITTIEITENQVSDTQYVKEILKGKL